MAITILAASQLLYAFGSYHTYASALHDAALGAFIGQTLTGHGAFPRILEVLLAAFSVVVFGSFAAILGSFLTESRADDRDVAGKTAPATPPAAAQAAAPSTPPADHPAGCA